MKDTYYFSHDYNPTSDPKIQALIGEYGAVGYGIFWRIVEMLHEDELHKLQCKKYIYLALAKQMLTSVEQVESIIKNCIDTYELFKTDGDFFWSERVMRNINKRAELSNKRSKAGKMSAEMRKNSTSVEQVSTSVQQNPTKERKVKENKVNEKKENNNEDWILKVDDKFKDTVSMYLDYRKGRKESYKTEKSFMLMVNKLIQMSGNNPIIAKQIVEQSMINNWAGLFELKTKNTNSYEQATTTKTRKKLY